MFSKPKTRWIALVIIFLLATGGFYGYQTFFEDNDVAPDAPEMQTATIRRGDLVLYANGTGTLIPAAEASFGFRSSGQLLALYVEVGDTVVSGELLAEVDNLAERIHLQQAERALRELTSPAAVAAAEEALAVAKQAVTSTYNTLTYQISPTVFNWESEVERLQVELATAKAEVATEKVAELEKSLEYAEISLKSALYYYENEYIPDNFTVPATRTESEYISAPSEADITEARSAYALAQAELLEAEYYLAAIKGEEISEDATGGALSAFEQAQLELLSAQDNLEATQLYAPISGTVMSIDANVGDSVGTSSIVTISDLNDAYLEIFLDETDWGMIAVDYPVDVIFDVLPDKTFTGVVESVDPALYTEQNTSVIRAIVRLDDASFDGSKLPIGSAAAVEVIGGRAESALLVPIEALREASPGKYTVFVMIDGEPKLRMVEIGLMDLFYAEVISGLDGGDVVTTGITETE